MAVKFYLGIVNPKWLEQLNIPMLINPHYINKIKKEINCDDWILDSGGFNELLKYGEYRFSEDEYIEIAKRTKPNYIFCQDWMCEENIIANTGLTVREHQTRTIKSYLSMKEKIDNVLPVIQGHSLQDYIWCIKEYQKNGVEFLPFAGIGSVCRRSNDKEIYEILSGIKKEFPDIKLHGFGVKINAFKFPDIVDFLYSADSAAWSVGGFHQNPKKMGCDCIKKNCASCQKYAIQWYNKVNQQIEKSKGFDMKEVNVLSQKITDNFSIYHGDSVEVTKGIPDNSIGYSMFSPPFSNLFVYSDSIRDIGNCSDDNEFFNHFKYLISELFRITKPGRNLSFHIMNPSYTIQSDGFMGIKDLRGDLVYLFQKAGWIYYSEFVIWKDPLVEATRTKALRLAHKQVVTDSARCGHGGVDYIVTMKKPGDNPDRIEHPDGFTEYIGEEWNKPTGKYDPNPSKNKYSHEIWQRYASPVWMDIRQTHTLQTKEAKEKADEPHICPLQIDTVDRCLELWSKEGDIVLDPFAGIGTVPYCAILKGRKGIGIELKQSYYRQAVKNCMKASKGRMKGFIK